jgi:hypothetical protein
MLTDHHECIRLQLMRSIAMRSIVVFVIERIRGFKFHAARPFNDDARVSTDVDMRAVMPLGLERMCARSQYVRSIALPGDSYIFMHIFHPFNCILILVTCNTLKHQKLQKHLEKDTTKSLTDIS